VDGIAHVHCCILIGVAADEGSADQIEAIEGVQYQVFVGRSIGEVAIAI